MSGGGNMDLNLFPLIQGTTNKIDIDQKIVLNEEYQHPDIVRVEDAQLKGAFEMNEEEEIILLGTLSGTMIVRDSISLEEISHSFSIDLEEIIEEKQQNEKNRLDIMDILWQNIVLEVPITITNVDDFSKFHGNGWKLVSENELEEKNNPFNELAKMMGEE